MKLVALLLVVTCASALELIPAKLTQVPFKVGKKYTYDYSTLVRVINPALPEQTTSSNVKCEVDFWFDWYDNIKTNFKVVMKVRNPVIKVLKVDPLVGPVPRESIIELKRDITRELMKPVQFIYEEGIVKLLQHIPNEKLWSLNIKKGIINMMHVDLLAGHRLDSPVFNKTETSIHGTCMTTYTMETPLRKLVEKRIISIRKTIDVATCENSYMKTFSTFIPETLKVKEPVTSPLKAITMMEYNLTKTPSGFKVLSVNVFGEVIFDPLNAEHEGIVSVTNQTLVLLSEETMKDMLHILELKTRLVDDSLIMKVDREIIKTPYVFQRVNQLLKSYISDLITQLKDSTLPVPKKMTLRSLELIKILRTVSVNDMQKLWFTYAEGVDMEVREWFVRILTLVNSENTMKVVFSQLSVQPDSIPIKLVKEYISTLGLTPFVTEEVIEHIKKFCSLDLIVNDAVLTKTCLVTRTNLMRSYCKRVPFCKLSSPTILISKLEKFSSWTDLSLTDMKERDMLEYITIAETTETVDILKPLLRIARNRVLPLQVRVRAVLALRPLALKLSLNVTVPVFKLFRDLNLPEELRLAAVTVIMEYPTPTVLLACVQDLKIEPSHNIRKFIFDTVLTLTESKEWPVEILEAAVVVKDMMIKLGLVPEAHRWLRQSSCTVYPIFTGVKGFDLIVRENMHLTNKSIFPRNVFADVSLKIMGRKINLMEINLRAEGLQELLQRFTSLRPTTATEMTKKITELMEKLSTVPVKDEDFKLFANLRLFGKQISTFNAVVKLEDDPLKGLLSNEFVAALLKNEHYQLLIKDIRIPVEMMVLMPTCNGITLVHDMTSFMINRITTTVKAKTTPSLLSWRMLFSSPKTADVSLSMDHSSHLLIRGSIFFSLPFLRCGTQFTHTVKTKLGGNLVINIDLVDMVYESNIDLHDVPTVRDLAKMETKSETFVWIMEAGSVKPRVISQRIFPEHIINRLTFLTTDRKKVESRATIQLKFGPSKYLRVLENRVVLSEIPADWVLINHGESGRIVTLCIPSVGCLKVDPVTKKLIITTTKPTYWVRNITADNQLILSTLVPTLRYTAPSPEPKSFCRKIVQFAELFQQEGIEIKEMESIHKMFNENYWKNEVKIMTIDMLNDDVIVSEKRTTPMKIVFKKYPNQLLEEYLEKTPICTGEEKQYAVCVTGYTPLLSRRSLMKTIWSPTMIKLYLPKEFQLRDIKIRASKTERTTNTQHSYKLKVYLVGLLPEKSFVLILNRNVIERKISMVLHHESELRESTLMCVNADYYKDSLSVDVSMEPTCQIKHFKIKVVGSPIFPRHWLRVDWLLTHDQIPQYLYKKMLYMKSLVTMRTLPVNLVRIFARTLFGDAITTEVLPTMLATRDLRTINGSITFHLLKETLARITIDVPMKRIVHKLSLPYLIYTIPRGTVNFPLIRKLQSVVSPTCFYGRDYVNTFDGVGFNLNTNTKCGLNTRCEQEGFHTRCEQVLIQNCSALLPRFMVTVRHTKEMMKIVKIILEETEIILTPSRFDAAPEIMINKRIVTLRNNKLITRLPLEIVFEPELKTLIFVSHKLRLRITIIGGKSISLTNGVNPLLFGKVCGLCGDLNADRRLEMVTPERVPVENPLLFGLSWIIPGNSCDEECPWRMTKKGVRLSKLVHCRPLIKLPSCKSKCRPTAEMVKLRDVPVACSGNSAVKKIDIKVPIDCTCTC